MVAEAKRRTVIEGHRHAEDQELNEHTHDGSLAFGSGPPEERSAWRGLEIYGVCVGVAAPDHDALELLVALLPPGIPRCEPAADDAWFVLLAEGEQTWSYRTPLGPQAKFADLTLVLAMIDTELRRYIAENATGVVFIHAGVVAHRGRAIVIPGDSFSGKTTLVAELVRAGAEYYSDEFAVIDDQGLVHPFARPLSIRMPRPRQHDRTSVESLGGTVGVKPVPVGLIAATAYRPETSFRPQRRSVGQGMLTLLAHSARAHEQPQETLTAARRAASDGARSRRRPGGSGRRGADTAGSPVRGAVRHARRTCECGARAVSKSAGAQDAGTGRVAFEVYGTTVQVTFPDAELVPQVVKLLPLHASRCEPRPPDRRFALERDGNDGHAVLEEGSVQARYASLENALAFLRHRLFYHAVHHARDHLIVSAGVVAQEGRAIVLPGPSWAGKTMLVAALLRAGAVYYADDWAILDPQGRVHPYPTRLFRLGDGKVTAESLGAVTGDTPIPVGLIALTAFAPDGRWDPQTRTPAQGMMMLVEYAYGLDDPSAAMKIAHSAAADAVVVQSERGEADEAAAGLLEIAAQARAGGSP